MGDPYPAQLQETAQAVANAANLQRWSMAWQSAGRTAEPWLGPSILEVLQELPSRGVKGVVVCPAGFVSDHLEILYDLDIEASQLARSLGLAFARTALPNADQRFVSMLAGIIREVLDNGEST
jgi:ferrochelatase